MTIIITAFERSSDGGKGLAWDTRSHRGLDLSSSTLHPKRNAPSACPAASDLFNEVS